jgi:hypothetical protein
MTMSDKLTLKGDVQIREPEVDDWFDFDIKVMKAINANPGRSINAVAEFKSYGESEILETYKITGKLLSAFSVFSKKILEKQFEFTKHVLSCTVTLKAVKKGKVAQKALDTGQLALFSSTPRDLTVEEYTNQVIENTIEDVSKLTDEDYKRIAEEEYAEEVSLKSE